MIEDCALPTLRKVSQCIDHVFRNELYIYTSSVHTDNVSYIRTSGTLNGFVFEGQPLCTDPLRSAPCYNQLTYRWKTPLRDELLYDIIIAPRGQFTKRKLSSEKDDVGPLKSFPGRFDRPQETEFDLDFLSVVKVKEDFKGLSPLSRNCYFPDEMDLDFFPIYSEPNCVLECAWKRAEKDCGCVPWILRGHFPKATVCEYFGNICFQEIVDNRYPDLEETCSGICLSDCEVIQYQVSEKAQYIMGTDKDFCSDSDVETTLAEVERNLVCKSVNDKFDVGGDPVLEKILDGSPTRRQELSDRQRLHRGLIMETRIISGSIDTTLSGTSVWRSPRLTR